MQQLHTLALCIGLRPAARRLGIKERTALTWSHRGNWKLSEVFALSHCPAHSGRPAAKSNAITAHEALTQIFSEQSEDTRLYLSAASLKAAHDASKAKGHTLRSKSGSTGLLNVARTTDIVHGWTAARQQPAVQIANVVLPTPEQSADLKAVDRRLDALTRLFNQSPTGGGGGASTKDA